MRTCLLHQPPFDAAALACGAAAALVDISSPDALCAGVALLRQARETRRRPLLFVRTPSLDDARFFEVLEALEGAPPDGVLLGAAESGAELQRLAARLAVFEAEAGREDGATRIMAEIATPAGALALAGLGRPSHRLAALLFAGTKLAESLGVEVDAGPVRRARAEIVLAAAAAGAPALDEACRAPQALRAECLEARRDGFAGKCAARPEEVPAIEEAFCAEGVEKSPQSARYLRA